MTTDPKEVREALEALVRETLGSFGVVGNEGDEIVEQVLNDPTPDTAALLALLSSSEGGGREPVAYMVEQAGSAEGPYTCVGVIQPRVLAICKNLDDAMTLHRRYIPLVPATPESTRGEEQGDG